MAKKGRGIKIPSKPSGKVFLRLTVLARSIVYMTD